MNKNSNVYTIIYLIIIVVVVGTALAFTSMSLKERQTTNADADKMKQILMSIHLPATDKNVGELFDSTITEQLLINSQGQTLLTVKKTSDDNTVFNTDIAAEIRKPADQRALPVFVARTNDGTKYIIPLYGAGLWGPIWGYVALDSNGSTVYGAYFSHASETPGLGAEIETEKFRGEFDNKDLFKNGNFLPIEVVKAGQKPTNADADYIDGIAGGTITSKGVGAMLDNCLTPYQTFLQQLSDIKPD